MKPFNLEEYLANPSREVVTRDGHSVRIVCTDARSNNYPIVALVSLKGGTEVICGYTKQGTRLSDKINVDDLFFATKKKEGWVSLYKCEEKYYPGMRVYSTKEEAESSVKRLNTDNISIAKVEWEE